jgi:hypothetical protein
MVENKMGGISSLLWTGSIACFFALFRPLSCARIAARSCLHPGYVLILLVTFSHAPEAEAEECWATRLEWASDFVFYPIDFEYSRSPLEALDRQSQKAIQSALSILPTACTLNECKKSPDIIYYYNNISPPLPSDYYRSAGCEWTCPQSAQGTIPPNRLSAAGVSLHSSRTVDSACGVSSFVIKLSAISPRSSRVKSQPPCVRRCTTATTNTCRTSM